MHRFPTEPRFSPIWPRIGAWLQPVLLLAILCAAGCFKPDYPQNLPCGEENWCPPGQVCNAASICVIDTGEPLPDANNIDAVPPPFVIGIDIGEDVSMNVGDTLQFSAVEVWSDGARIPIDAGELLIWRSTDNGIVWLDFNGLATAETAGAATVTGRYEGLIDAAEVTVVAP